VAFVVVGKKERKEGGREGRREGGKMCELIERCLASPMTRERKEGGREEGRGDDKECEREVRGCEEKEAWRKRRRRKREEGEE